MLRMLSGLAGAAAGVLSRPRGDWSAADDGEINEAVAALLERRYGWHTRWGGSSGPLYYRGSGDLARARPGSFYPATSWDDAAKAARECAEGGMRLRVVIREGRTGPRGLCERMLAAHGAERPVPEIVCRSCRERVEAFPDEAEARGWRRGYPSRDMGSLVKRFPRRGWGFMGQCPACRKGETC